MKSSPFHNRIRLLALLAAFVLACAGCVWLFLHSGRANRRQEAEPVSASAQTAEAAALPNFAAPVLYDAQSEVTEELPDDHANYPNQLNGAMSVLSEMNFRYLAWHCFIDNTTSHPLSLRFPSPQNASGSPWRGRCGRRRRSPARPAPVGLG